MSLNKQTVEDRAMFKQLLRTFDKDLLFAYFSCC